MELDILAIGICTVDLIACVPDFPRPDGHMNMTALVTSLGGIAAIAGATAARLGAHVGYAGTVGDDDAGRGVFSALRSDGVDVTLLDVQRGAGTPSCIVISNRAAGTRSILNDPNVASYGLHARAEVRSIATQARYLHLDFSAFQGLAQDILPYCRGAGTRVSIDAGVDFSGIWDYLPYMDVYASTDDQIKAMTGEPDLARGMTLVRAAGPEIVVATLGERGSAGLSAEGRMIFAPAFDVPVIDTLGAGDVFHGALLYALLKGRNLEDALEFSNAAAALSCQVVGGRNGCPTLGAVEALLAAGCPRKGQL